MDRSVATLPVRLERVAGASVEMICRRAEPRVQQDSQGVREAKTVWVIAHRGASGVAPENTLAAFRRAVELGAGFIETDLQLSRDARLVGLHDETLDRTTDGRGPVSAKTLEELRRMDAGSWFRRSSNHETANFAGEHIPTIEEILAFGREHEIGLHLEVKAEGPS